MPLEISAFPKCYLDQIAGSANHVGFRVDRDGKELDADGLEMYEGFFDKPRAANIWIAWAMRWRQADLRCRCCAARLISRTLTRISGNAAIEREAKWIAGDASFGRAWGGMSHFERATLSGG